MNSTPSQQILVDSSHRNRKQFPYPSEFDATVKTYSSSVPSDPLVNGGIIFDNVVVSYLNQRIELTSAIPLASQSLLLGKHIEIVDPNPLTLNSKSFSKVSGFSTNGMYIYCETPLLNIAPLDLIFIRQIAPTSLMRVKPSVAVPIGGTTLQITWQINHKNLMLRRFSGALGIYHTVISVSSSTITFHPPTPTGFLVTDFIEIYLTTDNEGGMNSIGSVSNRSSFVNHEIRLEWLRIPRQPLFVDDSTIIPPSLNILVDNFSYLVVEFRNKNNTSGGVIQSNSQYGRDSQFIVPIEDQSGTGKFFTLRSSQILVMNYNPNDTLHFSVRTNSGELLKFKDENSVIEPNPDYQISALFTIQRV